MKYQSEEYVTIFIPYDVKSLFNRYSLQSNCEDPGNAVSDVR